MEEPAECQCSRPTAGTKSKEKPPMKAKSSRFDSLVARYYPAVYSYASRLTNDPREALVLTHDAFKNTQKQLRNRRDEVALVTILLTAVIRADLAAARAELTQCPLKSFSLQCAGCHYAAFSEEESEGDLAARDAASSL
jgi:DNA-directed RNA polymerase specialized sigma24 family protein